MDTIENKQFFQELFSDVEGYLCVFTIDRRDPNNKRVNQFFFRYPEKLERVVKFIDANKAKVDIYFSPFLYTQKDRRKEYIAETPCVWADGDDCGLEPLKLQPTFVVRTSLGRHSYFWKFKDVQTPDVGESMSKRVAYAHAEDGMDKSGWDLTQLLRVPHSYNHKYDSVQPIPKVVFAPDALYTPEDFMGAYDQEPDTIANDEDYLPYDPQVIPSEPAKTILDKYERTINYRALELFAEVPPDDWSGKLWELNCICIETGMSLEETFVVANEANCNKYKRDKRDPSFLWKEVQRAKKHVDLRNQGEPTLLPSDIDTAPKLLTDEQRAFVENEDVTFIEEYATWARDQGDAAPQYHPVGAFVILSTLLSGNIRLPTSFGTVVPNMWFMILADTTLTRKSTAMEMAVDLLLEIDFDCLLATDGSSEGLLTSLSARDRKPSLFLRDEITGLVDAFGKKDYMSGMMETFTKLYDGKAMKRVLRKETISLKEPILVFFSGGIRNKMVEIISHAHISSGFLPRFVFVTAESDLTRIRPIGPPTEKSLASKKNLLMKMEAMKLHYLDDPKKRSPGTASLPKTWNCEMTEDAWIVYNKMEMRMVEFAMGSSDPSMYTPMMDRLSKSGLKAAILIAASRMHKEKIVIQTKDILHAFYYVEQWAKHSLYMLRNINMTQEERKMQKIFEQIVSKPGIARSHLMMHNFLNVRETDFILSTLEQRQVVRRENKGSKSEQIYPSNLK